MSRLNALEHPAPPFALRLQPSSTVWRIGQDVTFYLEAGCDCYGTLLERGSNGNISVLFVDRPLSSGPPSLLPTPQDTIALRCVAPIGRERLCLVATLQPMFAPSRGLRATSRAVENTAPHFSEILEHVRTLPLCDWASAFCEFIIEP